MIEHLLLLKKKQCILQAAVDPKSIIPGRAAESISLVHYNDVANIDPRDTDPVGGAARFLTAVKSHKEEVNPLIIFSGNVFSPSMSKKIDFPSFKILFY